MGAGGRLGATAVSRNQMAGYLVSAGVRGVVSWIWHPGEVTLEASRLVTQTSAAYSVPPRGKVWITSAVAALDGTVRWVLSLKLK